MYPDLAGCGNPVDPPSAEPIVSGPVACSHYVVRVWNLDSSTARSATDRAVPTRAFVNIKRPGTGRGGHVIHEGSRDLGCLLQSQHDRWEYDNIQCHDM